jgi:hypothetical protein
VAVAISRPLNPCHTGRTAQDHTINGKFLLALLVFMHVRSVREAEKMRKLIVVKHITQGTAIA